MKAVILAAGKGNRLKPYTDELPKPLLAIGHIESDYENKTALSYILENLPSYIDEVIIITKHFKDKIDDFVNKNSTSIKTNNPNIKSIRTIIQGEIIGTLGALLSVKDCFKENERFLVLNGDDIHRKEDLELFNRYPQSFGMQKRIMPGYRSVITDENGIVVGLQKQNEDELQYGCYIATGVYLIDSNIFSFEPVKLSDGEFGLPQTLLQNASKYPMHAINETGWLPMNSHEELEQIRNSFL